VEWVISLVDDVVLKHACEDRSCNFCKSDATAIESGLVRLGVYELVGHGVAKATCGKYIRTLACLNVAGHEGTRFDKNGGLVDHSGEVFVKRVKLHCGRPSCPSCYRFWANREANKMEYRLEEARKLLVKTNKKTAVVEHLCISLPESMYGLSEKVMRKKVDAGLKARNIVGGGLIFHGFRFANFEEAFRINRPSGWRWSPHVHVLGFVLGGYGCRGCKKWCAGHLECNGFENRTRRENEKDGLIVKIAEDKYGEKSERKSVYWTARYELGHCTIKNDAKRAHVVTWFGLCSYRRLKVLPMIKVHSKCPLCELELVKARYSGVLFEGKDVFWAKLVQGGVEVAELIPEEQFYGSGNYGRWDD